MWYHDQQPALPSCSFSILTIGYVSPKCPLHEGGPGPYLTHGSRKSTIQNSILISSAVSAGLTNVSNMQVRPHLRHTQQQALVSRTIQNQNTPIKKPTHTQLFNGPLSRTIQVSRYHKDKTNLDFTGARNSEWQWHRLGNMQVCTSLQTDNHASTSLLSFSRMSFLLPNQQCRAAGIEVTVK